MKIRPPKKARFASVLNLNHVYYLDPELLAFILYIQDSFSHSGMETLRR